MTKYKVTNYGNTRTVYVKGQSWEITKNATINFDDRKVPEAEEVAEAFRKLPFIDVEVVKQPVQKVAPKKKKTITKKTKKKKVTAKKKKSKKIKRRKTKRRIK